MSDTAHINPDAMVQKLLASFRARYPYASAGLTIEHLHDVLDVTQVSLAHTIVDATERGVPLVSTIRSLLLLCVPCKGRN